MKGKPGAKPEARDATFKIFNVKPKVVDGQHVECRGAMVSKMPNVTWPKGTFVETVKEW